MIHNISDQSDYFFSLLFILAKLVIRYDPTGR
jgi:hypothetical protein